MRAQSTHMQQITKTTHTLSVAHTLHAYTKLMHKNFHISYTRTHYSRHCTRCAQHAQNVHAYRSTICTHAHCHAYTARSQTIRVCKKQTHHAFTHKHTQHALAEVGVESKETRTAVIYALSSRRIYDWNGLLEDIQFTCVRTIRGTSTHTRACT